MNIMTPAPWTCANVTDALHSRGYQRVPSEPASTILWYRSPHSSSEVSQYLALEHKPRANTYAVFFGVSCNSARTCMRSVSQNLRSIPAVWPSDNKPCWTLFNAGRALNWGYLSIPDPTNRTNGATQFSELCEKILNPIVEQTVICQSVLDVLLATEFPYEWSISNPMPRAAEVIAISRIVGKNLNETRNTLLAYKSKLYRTLQTGPAWDEALSRLIHFIGTDSVAAECGPT